MAVFKCKMCGGTLEIGSRETVATCEYCGTPQTLPRLEDDRRANLYDRANHFRRNNEFDKAMGIYEQILNEDSTDAEAYWSLILCRYGIEYVEDPVSRKRVPTVNRAQFTSVYDDDNYKSALQHADEYQRSIYEEEAGAINEIQKGILAISQKEEPFDVFICYKESDSNGRRTPDSVLANDLYHQLTQEGFKVFFARITLEDKLGSAYEPYIFAALNSARVMVVLGTKPEFFQAVWVRNEWSRYLALIRQGQKKMLIPAYKDMDPYDLPEEFSHLQAQDMSKLGFMQDLIRGIQKIAGADTPEAVVVKETVIAGGNTGVEPLLKRAFMFLEDGDWESADEYCEKVLDIEPENAQAYLGKLMAELKVRRQESLKNRLKPFDHNSNYQKVLRFADETLKTELVGCIEYINTRNENARIEGVYNKAKHAMDEAVSEKEYKEAAGLFETIHTYRDADERICECRKKIEEIKAKEEADRLEKECQEELERQEAEKRAQRNKKIGIITMTVVGVVIALIMIWKMVIIPNSKYNAAVALMESGNTEEAYEAFCALGGYKDSMDQAGFIKKEQLKYIKVGESVSFGTYEQDNDISNGREEIEWLVLEVQEEKVLVISKYGLDYKPYHTENEAVTWESCTLRQWLNREFMDTAFSAAEQALIPTVTVSADRNPEYDTDPGKATQDQVFLLSILEADRYFSTEDSRRCKATDYADAEKAYVSEENGNCVWWLRSPNGSQYSAVDIGRGGGINEIPSNVRDNRAVRPALWINLTP